MANTEIIDCTTCKYGYEDERLGIRMCHHPKRFSEDCINFNMHEEKESEHLADARKTSPKDLESYAQRVEDYYDVGEERGYLCTHRGDIKDAVIAGAKWQKEQDEKEQADLFTIVALGAAQRAKEQMMKEAVEGEVDFEYFGYKVIKPDLKQLDTLLESMNHGDKVKIIIVKED